MDNLAKHSELLFIWDAKMCNPNGDMSADNAPRFDDVDEKAIVSDVRVKRTIRDDLQNRKKELIFINNEEINSNGLNAEGRFDQLKKISEADGPLNVFLSCIDNRLFGGVAPKSGIQLVGAVQFSWAKSLNKTEIVLKSGTGAFANPKKDSEADRFQKTFRADNYIPYGLFPMYGTINRLHAERSSTSEEDILNMLDSLWHGTKLLNTRSKEGQKPRIMIRIIYKEKSNYFIGLIDELLKLENEDSDSIRNIDSAFINFDKLINTINNKQDEIEKVVVVLDDTMNSYKEKFESIKKVDFVDELSINK